MKFFIAIFVFVALVYASPDAPVQIQTPQPVTDGIVIEVVNDWTLPSKALDLTIIETPAGPFVAGIDNGEDRLNVWENGQVVQQITLPPVSEGHSWGVVCRNQGDTVAEILVNDFDKFDMYQSNDVGVTWDIVEDPAGKYGRGMDYDGTHYWTVINSYTDELCRFELGGASETWAIPEIGANQQGSGLATFPLEGGDTGIALAAFDTNQFFFFQWDGTDISYIGSALTPFADSVLISLGLAYCESTGHFFWTYGPAAGYRMVEFTVAFNQQALPGTTWGAIKSTF